MLTDRTVSHNRMAARLELHKSTVRNVRLGVILEHIHPEIARWDFSGQPTRTCHSCQHWNTNRCSFGFPETILDGIRFAEECELYMA